MEKFLTDQRLVLIQIRSRLCGVLCSQFSGLFQIILKKPIQSIPLYSTFGHGSEARYRKTFFNGIL